MNGGQKARNLTLLADAGFNVPDFYVIPYDSIKLSESGLAEQVKKYNDWRIKRQVAAVAVRSSSNLEDSSSSSYAGQFKTLLDISGDTDFTRAIKEVSTYQIKSKYSKKRSKISIIVQEYIDPDHSGVLFTVNPASGKSEMVINYAAGNGETVVGGKDVNQYFVNRENGKILGKNINLPKDDKISAQNIRELTATALKIEKLFGEVQDIEWAIKDNELYILQSRPITKLSHLRLWDSSNLSESFPGIVLPLTFSVARRGYNLVYKSQAYAAGLDWYQLEQNHRVFDSMVGLYKGKMYYNLISWYKFISLFPANKSNQKFLDQQLSTVGDAVYMPASSHGIGFKVRFWTKIIKRTLLFKHELNKFYKKYHETFVRLDKLPQSDDVYFQLEKFELLETNLIPHFGRTVDNDFLVMTYHGILKKYFERWGININTKENFLGSMQSVVSADQALLLYSIASKLRRDSKAMHLISKKHFDQLERHLDGTEIEEEINHYKTEFGHRFAEDQKIEAINPLLSRDGLYEFIALYVMLDPETISERLKNSHASSDVEIKIAKQLSPHRKVIYKLLLRRLKKHLRIREKNRLLRGKVYAYMRELFPEIGESLKKKNILVSKQDIYYLEIEEIYQLLQGALAANDLNTRISHRKKAYEKFDDADMPERFISTDIPIFADLPKNAPLPKNTKSLKGTVSSPGSVTGKAIVLTKPEVPKEPFDILVVNHTDPGWTPLIALARGIIVEHGGMLSHAAIITRELGIPSIIGVENATKLIKNGQRVTINPEKSVVELHK